MDYLLKTKLFNLLSGSTTEVTTNELKNAYENFVKEVLSLNQSENDYLEIFRALSFTRIEFKILQTKNLCEQGGKCA